MKHFRKLLLGMGTALLAMAFVLPAAAQADPFWYGGEGFVTGKADLGFSNGGGSISPCVGTSGSSVFNGEESAEAEIVELEMPDSNCPTNIPGCFAEEAAAEDLPWHISYTGGGGFPVVATVHGVKLHLTMSEGCGWALPRDVVITGTITGEQTYAEWESSTIYFNNASGMFLGKVGGAPVKTNGTLTFESSSYVY
jgi:hypothetical protein